MPYDETPEEAPSDKARMVQDAADKIAPLIKEADPELERLLAEEEEIERTAAEEARHAPHFPSDNMENPHYDEQLGAAIDIAAFFEPIWEFSQAQRTVLQDMSDMNELFSGIGSLFSPGDEDDDEDSSGIFPDTMELPGSVEIKATFTLVDIKDAAVAEEALRLLGAVRVKIVKDS